MRSLLGTAVLVGVTTAAFMVYRYKWHRSQQDAEEPPECDKLDNLNHSSHSTHTWVNRKGLKLHVRRWAGSVTSDIAKKKTIFGFHGLHEHCHRKAHDDFGNMFSDAGYDVIMLDHQGHGRSQGVRGHAESWEDLVADALDFVDENTKVDSAEEAGVQREFFIFGHSMGGQIATRVVLARPNLFAGALLSAPLLWFDSRKVPLSVVNLFSSVLPRIPLAKLDISNLASDPEVELAARADPLYNCGAIRARLGAGMLASVLRTRKQFPNFNVPFYILHGSLDTLVDPHSSEIFIQEAGTQAELCKHEVFDGLGHEILHEKQAPQILARMLAFLESMSQ